MMIQVIERAAGVIGVLSEGDSALAGLAERTGLQKTTLCNILRTLQDVGYVERAADGRYRFGQGLIQLARAAPQVDPVEREGRPIAEDLTRRVGETSVVAVLRKGHRFNVVYVSSEADVVVNERTITQGSVYNTATGRLLVSHADRTEFNRVVARNGLPGAVWNGLRTIAALEEARLIVRGKNLVTRQSEGGDIRQFAAPVPVNGRVVAAVGVSAVAARCSVKHVALIEASLLHGARRLAAALSHSSPSEAK